MRDGDGAGEMAPQLREPVTQPGRMEFGFQQHVIKPGVPALSPALRKGWGGGRVGTGDSWSLLASRLAK